MGPPGFRVMQDGVCPGGSPGSSGMERLSWKIWRWWRSRVGVARPGGGGTPAGQSPRAGNPQPGADGQGFAVLRFPPQEAAPNPLPKLTLASLPRGTSGRDFTWKSRPLQMAPAQTRPPGGGASPNPPDRGHQENGGEDMMVAAASRSWGRGSCSAPFPWPQMESAPLTPGPWRRAP